MRVKVIVALIAFAIASAASAATSEEMKKLDFLMGEWKGEGWMQRGPGKPQSSFVHEVIQSRAGGNAIVIEGKGNRKLEDGSAGEVVHEAFGVIWWDQAEKRYRFSAFTAQAGHADATFDLIGEKTAAWGFSVPQGKIRYTIQVNEKDEWNEVGEYSGDGKTWMKFFEMTLQRVK